MGRPTVVLDFDGVIHSYTSGYIGADEIPDPVIPGIKAAIDELRTGYRVVVVSTRCASVEGCCAVRRYLRQNGIEVDDVTAAKPPALCYIDDRAICFDGNASSIPEKVRNFKTWMEGGQNDSPVSNLRPCKGRPSLLDETECVGRFHGWSFENQCAIIEMDDGTVKVCHAHTIVFLDRAKTPDAPKEG